MFFLKIPHKYPKKHILDTFMRLGFPKNIENIEKEGSLILFKMRDSPFLMFLEKSGLMDVSRTYYLL